MDVLSTNVSLYFGETPCAPSLMLQVAGRGYAELLRTPLRRSSQDSQWTKIRLCEVALLGHHPQSAGLGSTGREFFHFGVHVSLNSVTDHSFNKISISSLERFSPNLVEPLQASALARSSPPASAWSAASSAVSGSVTVSG